MMLMPVSAPLHRSQSMWIHPLVTLGHRLPLSITPLHTLTQKKPSKVSSCPCRPTHPPTHLQHDADARACPAAPQHLNDVITVAPRRFDHDVKPTRIFEGGVRAREQQRQHNILFACFWGWGWEGGVSNGGVCDVLVNVSKCAQEREQQREHNILRA